MSNETPRSVRRGRRRLLWLALVAVVLIAAACVLVPAWLVQPFKAQTPGGLGLSYALRRVSPAATLAALAGFAFLAFRLWRGGRWYGRAALVLLALPVAASAWFARQNYFEWMFRPLDRVAHASAQEVDFVRGDEMVLAVELNGDAVAYPVRQLAYHHVVEDTVGGVPIVATY
jgi:Protein of unknown function (DUF3179)